MTAAPYPKSAQLDRPAKRPTRIRASRAEWKRLREAKLGPCRVCGFTAAPVELHHVVPRSMLGDDLPANLVPLCSACHERVHRKHPAALRRLAAALTEAERDYCVGKLGLGAVARLFERR